MNALSIVVAVLLFVLAGLWAVVGVSGLRGSLRRNRWVGVRAEATMRSDEAFSVANRVAAPGTLGAALIVVMGAALTLGVPGTWSVLFGAAGLIVALVVIGLVSGLAVRAAEAVPAAAEGGCGCCSGGDHEARADGGAEVPAADCGESSCGACTLRGVCSTDSAGSDSVQDSSRS